MEKGNLSRLNLIDDFLFGASVSHPQYGTEFCELLISILLQREIREVNVIPQRFYQGRDTNFHGSRIDVYVEEKYSGEINIDAGNIPAIYDVEAEKEKGEKETLSLPRRTRFYHSCIDRGALKSEASYLTLRRVYVIMIMNFDPFGYDQVLYSIRNTCIEVPEMEYDDGAYTLFFNTRGTKGECADEVRALLHYMEHSDDEESVISEKLRRIREIISEVKLDPEVEVAFLKSFERDECIRQEGRDEMQPLIDRAKAEAEAAKSEAETAKAEAETAKSEAEAEKRRAEEAEAELLELRHRFEELQKR